MKPVGSGTTCYQLIEHAGGNLMTLHVWCNCDLPDKQRVRLGGWNVGGDRTYYLIFCFSHNAGRGMVFAQQKIGVAGIQIQWRTTLY
ncbi:hypothetical protein D3C81_2009110 [compost metagenome]